MMWQFKPYAIRTIHLLSFLRSLHGQRMIPLLLLSGAARNDLKMVTCQKDF